MEGSRTNLHLGLAIVAERSSKFSDLLVFMEQSIPQKSLSTKLSLPALRPFSATHSRAATCFVFFGRAGKLPGTKNLASKIRNVCGI